MSDISSIGPGHGSVGPANRVAPFHLNGAKPAYGAAAPAEAAIGPATDRVELSDFARYLDKLRQLPGLPVDRIGHVRQAIEEGSYDTDEKLDIALERMIDDVEI